MELNSIRAVSSGGLKLAFLYVLYDVQRLWEMFAQVKEQVKTSNDAYELLEIDEDVDYSEWARKLRTFDTKIYLVADDQAHSRGLDKEVLHPEYFIVRTEGKSMITLIPGKIVLKCVKHQEKFVGSGRFIGNPAR